MNKYEFMEQLDAALKGNVSEQERRESIQYYSDYIEEEIGKGRGEEEVLDSLGGPGAIAKSIIDAKGYESVGEDVYESYEEEETGQTSVRSFKVEGAKIWFVIIGIILILLLVLSLVFKLVAALLPLVIPFAIVLFILKVLFDRR